jgi:VWFA-related protein
MRQKTPTLSRLLILPLILVLTASAQDIQIRTRVDLVVVPVSVKGSNGRPVTGLTQQEFVIVEDGRQQTITNFTADPLPLSAAVVIDTGLSEQSLSKVKQSFPALVGAFSDLDEVAIYRYDKYVAKILDFTTDKLGFEAAIKTFQDIQPSAPTVQSGPFSIPGPVINGQPVVPGPVVGASPQSKPAQVLHDAIFQATTDLSKRDRDRRKIVLLISDGDASGNDHSYDETLMKLLDTGVQIYAVGMDVAFLGRSLSVLGSYASDTGGDACYLSSQNALETCYSRSADQARNQYILGYVSSNKVPGELAVFRDIDVKLTREGYETRHRKGYYQYP